MNRNGERDGCPPHTNKDDPRFAQLMALARDGNEEAAGDLWLEYGVVAGDVEDLKGG